MQIHHEVYGNIVKTNQTITAGSKSSKFKWRFRNKTNADGTVEVKIAMKILG